MHSVVGALSIMALGLLGTTSCVDDKYDFDKDIDMTIGVGGDHFAIPVGNTEQIGMNKIVKPEDSELIEVRNTEYHLVKNGIMDGASTSVNEVTVDGTEMVIEDISLVSENDRPESGADITNDKVSQSGDFTTSATGIDAAVKEIGTLTANVSGTLSIRLTLEGSLNYSEVDVKQLMIELPEIFKFEADENLKGHTLILKNRTVRPSGTLTYDLKFTGYDFMAKEASQRKVEDGVFKIHESVNVAGSVVVKNVTGGNDLVFKPTVTVSDLQVNQVYGLIQPKIDDVTTQVELDGIPDFLQDEEVTLDIDNPVFMFKANNPLNTSVELDGVLTPQGGAAQAGVQVTFGSGYGKTPVVLEPNSVNLIALVRRDCEVEGAKVVVVDDLNNLIFKIPDQIHVELTPSVKSEKYYDVDLGHRYEIKDPSYDVDVPFVFGEGLTIVYNDSICDLGGDLEDLDVKQVNVKMTAHSTVPLQLHFIPEKILLKDAYGQVIEGVTTEVEGSIAESADGETEAVSEVMLKLTTATKGVLSRLDRITFQIKATPESAAANRIPFKETQWLQLKDIKLTVPGGIQVDLN